MEIKNPTHPNSSFLRTKVQNPYIKVLTSNSTTILLTNPKMSGWIRIFSLVLQLILHVQNIYGSGVFEIRMDSFKNSQGIDALDKSCCQTFHTNEIVRNEFLDSKTSRCPLFCHTYFSVCLKHYQTKIQLNTDSVSRLHDGNLIASQKQSSYHVKSNIINNNPLSSCTFGSFITPTLGQNRQQSQIISQLPFSFSWPGTFSIILDAWLNGSYKEAANYININNNNKKSIPSSDKLLLRLATQKSVNADMRWTSALYTDPKTGIKIKFSYRVVCDRHYYGKSCAASCRPRDDKFGHYVCGNNGQKICQQGWTGPYCTQAVCARGCHAQHGYCEKPGECRCRLGYKGKYCEDCIRYPGCAHGTCNKPWQCNCQEGWGGLYCNQDLNYCTNHKPCKNGGRCSNTGQGSYTCECREGFAGTNCQIDLSKCDPNYCLNDGICRITSNLTITCQCMPGYVGDRCETNTYTCANKPCRNGAVCATVTLSITPTKTNVNNTAVNRDDDDGKNYGLSIDSTYKCKCPANTQDKTVSGIQCQIVQETCPQGISFCLNGGVCYKHTNIITQISEMKCNCPSGYHGNKCEHRLAITSGSSFASGKVAATMPDNHFALREHFNETVRQLHETGHCNSINPCLNGGTCIERGYISSHATSTAYAATFVCRCAPGFTGSLCQIDVPDCATHPCANGGTCTDLINGFSCKCPAGFVGRDCTHNVDECALANQLYVRGQASSPPCANNGTCVDRINGYECECQTPDYYGDKCQYSTHVIATENNSPISNNNLNNAYVDQNNIKSNSHHLWRKHLMGDDDISNSIVSQPLIHNMAPAVATVDNSQPFLKLFTQTEALIIMCSSLSFVTIIIVIIGFFVSYQKNQNRNKRICVRTQDPDVIDSDNTNHYGNEVFYTVGRKNKNFFKNPVLSHQRGNGLPPKSFDTATIYKASTIGSIYGPASDDLYSNYYNLNNNNNHANLNSYSTNNDNIKSPSIFQQLFANRSKAGHNTTYKSITTPNDSVYNDTVYSVYEKNNLNKGCNKTTKGNELIFESELKKDSKKCDTSIGIDDDGYYSKTSTIRKHNIGVAPPPYSSCTLTKNNINAIKNSQLLNNQIDITEVNEKGDMGPGIVRPQTFETKSSNVCDQTQNQQNNTIDTPLLTKENSSINNTMDDEDDTIIYLPKQSILNFSYNAYQLLPNAIDTKDNGNETIENEYIIHDPINLCKEPTNSEQKTHHPTSNDDNNINMYKNANNVIIDIAHSNQNNPNLHIVGSQIEEPEYTSMV